MAIPCIRIDSHQHFWAYDPVALDWMTESMGVLKRDFQPVDLGPLLQSIDFQYGRRFYN
jgi:L-fuconolactonase